MNPLRPFRFALALCVALGLWLLTQPLAAWAGTIIVDTAVDEADGSCSDGDCSLRDALALAANGDTITFAGDYTIVLGSQLDIGKVVTLDGGGRAVTISGNNVTRLFNIQAAGDVTLSRLSLINGLPPSGDGGGIYNAGTLVVQYSTLSGNATSTTGHGGGIYNTGTLLVQYSTLSGNHTGANAGSGGGIYNAAGAMTVQNSTLSGNYIGYHDMCGYGGGIYNTGGTMATVIVQNSTLANNRAGSYFCGGGIYNAGAMTVRNTTITGSKYDGITMFPRCPCTMRSLPIISLRVLIAGTPAPLSPTTAT